MTVVRRLLGLGRHAMMLESTGTSHVESGFPFFGVLMVCLGNICRSPMAQVVAQSVAARGPAIQPATDNAAVLHDRSEARFYSAGTHSGCTGQSIDSRAKAALMRRGYIAPNTRSRAVVTEDFDRFNLILAMDRFNLFELQRLCPPQSMHKLRLFLDFAPEVGISEVPDPYYGDIKGFEHVLDLCEAGAHGLARIFQ